MMGIESGKGREWRRERECASKVYLNGVDNVSSDVDLINVADGGGIDSVVSWACAVDSIGDRHKMLFSLFDRCNDVWCWSGVFWQYSKLWPISSSIWKSMKFGWYVSAASPRIPPIMTGLRDRGVIIDSFGFASRKKRTETKIYIETDKSNEFSMMIPLTCMAFDIRCVDLVIGDTESLPTDSDRAILLQPMEDTDCCCCCFNLAM